jgi:hypothetical protein
LVILFPVLTALALTGSEKVQGPWAVSYGDLLSHPEANLFYPGSRLLQSGGWGEYTELCGLQLMCTPGDVAAFVGNQLVVEDVPPSQIFGWYQDKLTAAGWRPEPSGDSLHIAAFGRGPGEHFDLNVHNGEESRELLGGRHPGILYFTGIPTSWVYLDDVTNRPEGHLYFPGSSLVGSNGYAEGAGHLFGFDNPWVEEDLIAPAATRGEIEGWYQTELAGRGYQLVGTNSTGVADEFRRGTEIFKLILSEAKYSRGPYGVAGLMFSVEYEIDTCQGHHPPVCRR